VGTSTARQVVRSFGIKRKDRLHHVYVIGQTGTGKSTLLENLAYQDVRLGHGVLLLDPHGDMITSLLSRVPGDALERVVYFDPSDPENCLGFNPFAFVPARLRPVVAAGLLDAFARLWQDSWGPRLEHILRNCLLTLTEQPNPSLADVLRLLVDRDFRRECVGRLGNDQVRQFWLSEYERMPYALRTSAIAPIQNKVGAFLADDRLRRVLSCSDRLLDLRAAMDGGQCVLVNLSKGRLGEDGARLLGSLLVSAVGWTALTRADCPEPQRRDFFVYLDEFHAFASPSLMTMLAELRKYRVGLVLAHQHLAQLEHDLRDAVVGNAGTKICFRVGAQDVDFLQKEFGPEFDATDLTRLPNHHMYIRLMIDGIPSRPFSAMTLP
jgi:DNA helicase HerA-like ATPase